MQGDPNVDNMDGERRVIMKPIKIKNLTLHFNKMRERSGNKCRKVRGWLDLNFSKCFSPEAQWLQNHIMTCPRCQRRLKAYNKVNLAISFMKTQPHRLDLLMRANTQAINVLKHSLREAPKAQKLSQILPEPKLREKMYKYLQPALNCAACIVIMLLMKIGIFTSMDKFQSQGQKVLRQYYVSQVGEDLTNEIFPT
jgi:hypothetical protein